MVQNRLTEAFKELFGACVERPLFIMLNVRPILPHDVSVWLGAEDTAAEEQAQASNLLSGGCSRTSGDTKLLDQLPDLCSLVFKAVHGGRVPSN